jgi:hypothetical protein
MELQVMDYNIVLITEIISGLEKQLKQPWPNSYSACKKQTNKVMQTIVSRKYTSVRKEIERHNSQISKELQDNEESIVRAVACLCENYSEADDEIFKYLDGRSGPMPGYSIAREVCLGPKMDKLANDIRRFRQAIYDLIAGLQSTIENKPATLLPKPPKEPPKPETAGDEVGGEVGSEKLSWQARAIALLWQHRDWKIEKVAQKVNKSRQALYDDPEINAAIKARRIQKQAPSTLPHGEKDDETGNIEAWK